MAVLLDRRRRDAHRTEFLFLNGGHFLDYLSLLVFATVAALRLTDEWEMSYATLIPYATPGFIAFGICAIPAGWIADKWSREGMMSVFFCWYWREHGFRRYSRQTCQDRREFGADRCICSDLPPGRPGHGGERALMNDRPAAGIRQARFADAGDGNCRKYPFSDALVPI